LVGFDQAGNPGPNASQFLGRDITLDIIDVEGLRAAAERALPRRRPAAGHDGGFDGDGAA